MRLAASWLVTLQWHLVAWATGPLPAKPTGAEKGPSSTGRAGSLEFPWRQLWHCMRVPRARTPLAPVRASYTHPGTGCPGTEGRAQPGAWCQGPCPGSAREEFQFHLWDRGGRGARLLPEQPLPAAGLPGITSISWAASRLCTLPSQPYPQPHCPLRQGPWPLPAAPTAPSGRRLFGTHTCSPLSRAQSCALTLLAGLQLFHFQVMGELCKRNPTGLRRSIPPILCFPWLPLHPLRHRTSVWLHPAQPPWKCGCLGAPATG